MQEIKNKQKSKAQGAEKLFRVWCISRVPGQFLVRASSAKQADYEEYDEDVFHVETDYGKLEEVEEVDEDVD